MLHLIKHFNDKFYTVIKLKKKHYKNQSEPKLKNLENF